MVVYQEMDTSIEHAVTKNPVCEQKGYIIVKNHVRELTNTEDASKVGNSDDTSLQCIERKSKLKTLNFDKIKKGEQITSTSSQDDNENAQSCTSGVDASDLQELKIIYKKCKEVMRKIESKYGHLLDVDNNTSKNRKRKNSERKETSDSECQCAVNKKIIFDDDGEQMTVDISTNKHICLKKPKWTPETESKSIQIEYSENEIILPDDLQELGSILKDPGIENTYRNKVIDKIKSVKQENANEIRFNKQALIEKLKSNPDELLDFKGTNLSSLPGYL